jgi:hypothetical protein
MASKPSKPSKPSKKPYRPPEPDSLDPERIAYVQSLIDPDFRHYVDDRIAIKPAGPKGLGVFAVKRFFPGEVVCEVNGKVWRESEYEGSRYCMELGDKLILEPDLPGALVNHSCSPNCVLHEATRYSLAIVTTTLIEPGIEFVYDYGWKPDADLPRCHCRSPLCRGWMVARDKIKEQNDLVKQFRRDRRQGRLRIQRAAPDQLPASRSKS